MIVSEYHSGKTQGPVGVQHLYPDNISHATVITTATYNSSFTCEGEFLSTLTDEKIVDSDVQPADFLIAIRDKSITLKMVHENMDVLKQHA
ncbi:hypothetical protein F8M41_022101 [Gigaspora margarita]|uniref:Uncharacterized protein n=1 Tax=Gigaspora margarita TaxID=4874 RepID=A0A8H4AFL6_GIGMA|nr:hypothetical protein F8M41_022101 [Gigaspora margarita]